MGIWFSGMECPICIICSISFVIPYSHGMGLQTPKNLSGRSALILPIPYSHGPPLTFVVNDMRIVIKMDAVQLNRIKKFIEKKTSVIIKLLEEHNNLHKRLDEMEKVLKEIMDSD